MNHHFSFTKCFFFRCVSFFFDANAVGQSKAKFSMQALQEMNPDVSSDYLDESVETVLSNNPEFFNSFKVVIASALKEKTLLTLSRMLWSQNIPFVHCRSIGFIASARLQYKEHFVIEAHPDNKQSDLRLDEPFDALKKYLDVCHFIINIFIVRIGHCVSIILTIEILIILDFF